MGKALFKVCVFVRNAYVWISFVFACCYYCCYYCWYICCYGWCIPLFLYIFCFFLFTFLTVILKIFCSFRVNDENSKRTANIIPLRNRCENICAWNSLSLSFSLACGICEWCECVYLHILNLCNLDICAFFFLSFKFFFIPISSVFLFILSTLERDRQNERFSIYVCGM